MVEVVKIVRCRDCNVPHNSWLGCPMLNGLVTPPDFYCAFGRTNSEPDKENGKMINQKQETVSLIELHIKKVKRSIDEHKRVCNINKTVGVLTLARTLDIITIEEFEHYFSKIFE